MPIYQRIRPYAKVAAPDIGAILKGAPGDFDESVVRIVQEQAQQFVNDLF